MGCFHPLKAYQLRKGEKPFFVPCKLPSGKYIDSRDWQVGYDRRDSHYILIPCGQCTGCRLEYSRQWAVRCLAEMYTSLPNSCHFVTLTYDDEHLPDNRFAVNPDTGEVLYPTYPVCRRDVQLFIKRLRELYYRTYPSEKDEDGNIKNPIRFYGCAEYGGKNGRPHYHIIFFNLLLDLLPYRYKSHSGYPLWESPIINSSWNKGLAPIGSVTFESVAYCARYLMKKHKGKDFSFYAEHGLEPEFTLCSTRPGIGSYYYQQHKDDIYFNDVLDFALKGRTVRPPRYFDRMFGVEEPDRLQSLKDERLSNARDSQDLLVQRSGLSLDEILRKREFLTDSSILGLTRAL